MNFLSMSFLIERLWWLLLTMQMVFFTSVKHLRFSFLQNYFQKSSISDVWLGYKYASDRPVLSLFLSQKYRKSATNLNNLSIPWTSFLRADSLIWACCSHPHFILFSVLTDVINLCGKIRIRKPRHDGGQTV